MKKSKDSFIFKDVAQTPTFRKPTPPPPPQKMTKIHYIKLQREFADDVISGRKSFEVRYNDRGYQKGDKVIFTVYDGTEKINHPLNDRCFEITYVLSGWGIKEEYVVFAIEPTDIDPRIEEARRAITYERRPCYVKNLRKPNEEKKRALFHRWVDNAYINNAILVGTVSGQVWQVGGLVEYENGKVDVVPCIAIEFADGGKFDEYAFFPQEEK